MFLYLLEKFFYNQMNNYKKEIIKYLIIQINVYL